MEKWAGGDRARCCTERCTPPSCSTAPSPMVRAVGRTPWPPSLPLDGLLGFFCLFLGLLCLFISFVGGLGGFRREPVRLVGRFGLGLRLLLQQTFRLGLRGNQMSP